MAADPNVIQTILGVGAAKGANQMQMLSALSAGLVESGLQNLRHGDRDSQGVFQQRPSQGWGTVAQVTDPRYAAEKYFTELMKLDWKGTPGQMAQRVQRSAYPDRYDQRMGEAQQLLAQYGMGAQLGGGIPDGLDLSLDLSSQIGQPELDGQEDEDGELLATMLQSISDRVAGRSTGRFMPQMQPVSEEDQDLPGPEDISLPDGYVPLGGTVGQGGMPQLGAPSNAAIPQGVQPNAVRLAQIARRMGFAGSIGGIGSRSNKSDHPSGHALDFMVPNNEQGHATGWQMANYMHANRDQLGVKYLIFNGRIASSRDNWAWRPYTHPSGGSSPTLAHDDHVHASVY